MSSRLPGPQSETLSHKRQATVERRSGWGVCEERLIACEDLSSVVLGVGQRKQLMQEQLRM